MTVTEKKGRIGRALKKDVAERRERKAARKHAVLGSFASYRKWESDNLKKEEE